MTASEVIVRVLSRCAAASLALLCACSASAPARGTASARAAWERQGCFVHVAADPRPLESSRLEGFVFTAGYSPGDFPVPVAAVYARRLPDGEVLTADVDQDGRFAIPDAPEGEYEIGVCANGWRPWRGTVRIDRDAVKAALALPLELGT